MDNPVTIRSYTYPTEAAIMRSRMESEGITCFLKNELSIQINPFYSNALGGVELQVDESDVERAQEILDAAEEHASQAPAIGEEENQAGEIACQSCGALQSERRSYSVLVFMLSLVCLGIPFFYLGKKRTCHRCGKRL
jgi:hypothetical protein